jgi:hypothetical protein
MDPDPLRIQFQHQIQANYLQSKKFNFMLKFYVKNFILQALFQSAQHICEKREGSGGGAGTLTNGTGSRRSKNMRIRIPNTGSFVHGLDLGDPHKNLFSTVSQEFHKEKRECTSKILRYSTVY